MSRDYFSLYNSTVLGDGYPLSSSIAKQVFCNNLIVLSNLNRNYCTHIINKQWGTSAAGSHIVDYCVLPTVPVLESDDIFYKFFVNIIYTIDAGSGGAWLYVRNHGIFTMFTLDSGGKKQEVVERNFEFTPNIIMPYSTISCILELGGSADQVTIHAISYGFGSYLEHD
jgi:hypothetical protein